MPQSDENRDVNINQEECEGEKFIPHLRKNSLDADLPLTKDTTCGFGPLNWSFLQKFANKNVYVAITGISGAVFISRFTYFYGTISTLEKRFKIPSRNIGYQSIGHELMLTFVAICVTYFAGKGHKPRWIGLGLLTTALSCFFMALPHFIYGGGSVETLTLEHGYDPNLGGLEEALEREKRKDLCNTDANWAAKCDTDEGHIAPQVIFFGAQIVAGFGSAIISSLTSIYMDDNVKKEDSPILISILFFLSMTGPLLGFGIAGICLKFFVNPSLTPTIPNTDPRWVGLWWFGWLVIGIGLLSSALLTALFPKTLPDAAKRKHLAMLEGRAVASESILPASWNDFKTTLKRLLSNKVYVLCNLTAICSIYGTEPYYIYTPKYIESLYQKTPTESNFYTGTVGFIFTSIGTIASGIVVSRFKPSAKRIVQWNCLICIVQILCNITYSQLSCPAKEMAINLENFTNLDSCSANCNCDFVQYAPVCGEDGITYISSCHAGCSDNEDVTENATKIFTNCSCIASNGKASGGYATEGACPINCQSEFTLFLITMSFLRLIMATGVTGSFLLSVRCVAEKDKTISLGINMAFCSILGFLPIPVVFGAIVDSTCDLWGKTCTTSGNCWLYNGPSLRYLLNFSTCFANTLALCFNIVNSKFVKSIEIFDEEENSKNSKCSEETHKLETTNL